MRPTTPHRSPTGRSFAAPRLPRLALLGGLALAAATGAAIARQATADTGPASTPAIDPTAGDRAALIAEDMAQHPPQAQAIPQDGSHLQIAHAKLGGLLDRSVRGTENSEVGRVIDVLTGDDGKPAALELDVGGFMGVGNRKIAVAWGLFDLTRTGSGDPLRVALSEAEVRSAPAAESGNGIAVVTGLAGAAPKPRDLAPPAAAAPSPAAVAAPAPPPSTQGRP